jgi:hypothetical protein
MSIARECEGNFQAIYYNCMKHVIVYVSFKLKKMRGKVPY